MIKEKHLQVEFEKNTFYKRNNNEIAASHWEKTTFYMLILRQYETMPLNSELTFLTKNISRMKSRVG